MSASKRCIYPNLAKTLLSKGIYQLKFKDITDFRNQLEAHIWNHADKTHHDRSIEVLKDMHRHGFENNCHINYEHRPKNKSQKLVFPTDANFQEKNRIMYSKLKFKKENYLDNKPRNKIVNINIFLILHMLYTRTLKRPIHEILDLSDSDLKDEIEFVLSQNKIKPDSFKYFTHEELLPIYKNLLPRIHLSTLIFDQNMLLGVNIMEIYQLHAKLINENFDNFMVVFYPLRVDSLTKSKMNFNIGPKNTLQSIEMQISNTFLFFANSNKLKDKRGKPITDYENYFIPSNMEGLTVMYDICQYKLDVITKVKLTMGNSTLSFTFLLRPEFDDDRFMIYKCVLSEYKITPSPIVAAGKKTKKNKFLDKNTKKRRKQQKSKKK